VYKFTLNFCHPTHYWHSDANCGNFSISRVHDPNTCDTFSFRKFFCFSFHVSNANPFVFVTHATCLYNRTNSSKFKNSVFWDVQMCQVLGCADVSSEQVLSPQRIVLPLRVRKQRHIQEDLNPQKQFCETLKLKTLLVSCISCYF
jgi:hypothetical protein